MAKKKTGARFNYGGVNMSGVSGIYDINGAPDAKNPKRGKWDRRIGVFSAVILICFAAAFVYISFKTGQSVENSAETIEGRSEEGFARLEKRLELPDGGYVRCHITRRGRFDSRQMYAGFTPDLLDGMEFYDGAFLSGDIEYTHTIKLILKSDEISSATGDEAVFFKNGDMYYVGYREGKNEYRFAVKCPGMTDWFAELEK